jgi:hypothetical protein
VFQIVSTSGPYSRTTCLISRGKDNIKIDPDSIVLGSLVLKVLRLGEQKAYITRGIIRIGRKKRRGRENKKFNIRNNKRKENKKMKKMKK